MFDDRQQVFGAAVVKVECMLEQPLNGVVLYCFVADLSA
jgi:hypothetical protein